MDASRSLSEPLLEARDLYERYRRGEPHVAGHGFELWRMQFASQASVRVDDACAENACFSYPLFVPGPGPFGELVVILNGLNDTSYRKFFPWAASLARAGLATAVFPSAYLMNRRPRAWITPAATELALRARYELAPETATPINAVLSDRVAREPLCLLRDAQLTAADLQQLAATLHAGELSAPEVASQAAPRRRFFRPGARCHFLGYSMGGYIALALRLSDPNFAFSRIVSFCAGAATGLELGQRLDPVSPFILDAHATERLLGHMAAQQDAESSRALVASRLLELCTGTSAATRARLSESRDELTVIAGATDRVVPVAGIAANLGRVDRCLALGIHEYPFNLHSSNSPGATREIARSHGIAPGFEASFGEFIDVALRRFAGLGSTGPVS